MRKRIGLIILLSVVLALFIPVFVQAGEDENFEEEILHLDERGCTSCHKVVERDGKVFDYTLYAEVQRIEDHPAIKKEKVEEEGVLYCLVCHEDMGEKSFKKIIHPIHYFSEHFEGNCFSCHDISEKGEFVLFDEVQAGKE
ncbi:hypothetical protein JYK00_00330 [Thermosipho ferrireducens]|uniref:Doubled CXXCH motif domain-containing protein n=1 Tax=Thermosipho ferrireducens TaxID=2571116 RepID=A0ABX7S860_9BACT|nr:hypothetical protein [Thermosipho ferrireducens]QTA38031.1 hypothetical protein JYK00_00330 [Thermosipho ferrireducens]